ncbi:hypothetical protein ALC56_02990 [Trachymyrmex septentrionalis]|uniref:Synaptosomal-associated protein 29 n=1 Tax=Trachymyrmex septentrionalis TaxID=34720 RepID=A0A195FPY4_9HYME|nr:PREDICTED: uncharacterized protein LOC108745776 isoform X1 [Trachymyrmex septentrionalis]KYN42655.1 hypothetical protein ALC56_02990 [Trachymyrmex septentrionalis]
MSEDYQHACERAELLGLPKPSEEEWRRSQTAQSENRRDVDDDDAALQELDYVDDAAGRVGGGLDELNSILSTTQKKLNRFKTVCGSLGTLLKVKVNSRGGTPRHKPEEPNPDAGRQENQEKPESTVDEVITVETSDVTITDTAGQPANSGVQQKQIDLNEKMGSHLNKLDSLITKAENAQYSMQHQTKQMRKILKK